MFLFLSFIIHYYSYVRHGCLFCPIIAESAHVRQTQYYSKLPEAVIEPLSEGI